MQLGQARLRIAPVLRAARAAHRAFVSLVFCGVITALLAVVSGLHFWALVMGLWMFAAGVIEYRGAEQIRRLRPKVFAKLRLNQLLLGAIFILIGGWWMLQLKLGFSGHWIDRGLDQYKSTLLSGTATSGGARQVGGLTHLVREAMFLMLYVAYGSIVAFGLIVQGWMAWYYTHRGRQLRTYLDQTPSWIIDLQRSGHLG